MLSETLQYARDEIAAEPVRKTDLTALLTSIVDDMTDTGPDARMSPAPLILLECRPTALKRAIRNVAENAVKYGKKARISIAESRTDVAITVEDEGPGLPCQEISKVMEPFYRIESSRSRETGGVGLGLAIANSLIQRHRGTLVLENRTEGGLRATIRLPK